MCLSKHSLSKYYHIFRKVSETIYQDGLPLWLNWISNNLFRSLSNGATYTSRPHPFHSPWQNIHFWEKNRRYEQESMMTNCMPRMVPVLTLKVLHLRNPLSYRQTGIAGQPILYSSQPRHQKCE